MPKPLIRPPGDRSARLVLALFAAGFVALALAAAAATQFVYRLANGPGGPETAVAVLAHEAERDTDRLLLSPDADTADALAGTARRIAGLAGGEPRLATVAALARMVPPLTAGIGPGSPRDYLAALSGTVDELSHRADAAVAAAADRQQTGYARVFWLFVALVGTLTALVGLFVARMVRQIGELAATRARLETMAGQLRAAAEAAEAGNRAKSAFLATMSHEIRTPINGVLGLADLLADGRLDADGRALVDGIRSCGRSLIEVVNDILDFSKLEAGSFEIERIAFDPVATAAAAVAAVEPRLRETGLTLVLAPALAPGRRFGGDEGRIRQVMLNFLSNAVKFTEEGCVVLRLGERADAGGRTWLTVDVEDTGAGIPAEGKARLFREFSQVDASITRRFGGTGLGLAICRRIVEGLGGEIGADSEVGRGSRFFFAVPVEAEESAPALEPLAGLRFIARGRSELETTAIAAALAHLGARPAASADTADLVLASRRLPPEMTRAELVLTSCGSRQEQAFGALLPGRFAPPPCREPVPPPVATRRLDILVVEDNRVNREVAARMLARLGHAVALAENGAEAVAMVNARDYDAIFMDMQMPVMDGLEATRAIRRRSGGRNRNVPIVAMTANAFSADRDACLAAGMTAFLAKPVERQAVASVLDRLAGGGAAPAAERPAVDPDDDGIDRRRVRALVAELGAADTDFLVRSFLDEAPGLLVELSGALSSGDVDAARRALHTLKGAAINVGFARLSRQAETVMAELPDPNVDDLGRLMMSIATAENAAAALRRGDGAPLATARDAA